MVKYKNTSPEVLSFTLNDGTATGKEYIVAPGSVVELPSDNSYVIGLVGQGILQATETDLKPSKK